MNDERVQQALRMLDSFDSVGVQSFNLTRSDIDRQVVPEDYRPGRNIGAMRMLLPAWIRLSWKLGHNLIVRPRQPSHRIITQLDDLDGGQLDRAALHAFLSVETSPGNFHVWLAVEGGDAAFAKRVMKAIGSDPRASGSGRIAGSPNVKQKYAPNFPMVRIVEVQPGRKVEPAVLVAAGLVAPAVAPAAAPSYAHGSTGGRGWPDYERCLRGAPLKADGTPDRSRVDYLWAKWALERKNSPDGVRAKLLEVSEKAQQEWQRGNQNYVRRTVNAAASAIQG
jgi:hypothetical protein